MSIVSPAARDETAPNIVVRQPTPPQRAEKVTAAQVENDCPRRLQVIGEEITKRFNEAHEQASLLDDHVMELTKLMAEARELCDSGGFRAFQEKFFPNLRKSRVYEWLAIASKKKTVEETRAGTRERVAKHRANRAEASVSLPVTENSQPEAQRRPPDEDPVAHGSGFRYRNGNSHPEAQRAPPDHDPLQPISSPRVQTPKATNSPSSVRPGDEALFGFSAAVCELVRRTHNREAERFVKTTVPADNLATLGNLLTKLGDLKRSEAAESVAAKYIVPTEVFPVARISTGDTNESSQAINA